MSDDVLTSESPWPELAALDDFWDADETPPRGVPRPDVDDDADDDDDDPTPVNARRPVLVPTLPPPTTPAVAGPAPSAEPTGVRAGARPAEPPSTSAPRRQRGRWPRRVGAAVIGAAVIAAGVVGWQWNEGRHDAASAARILPSEPVDAPDVSLVQFELDRAIDIVVHAELGSGDALAEISGGFSLARSDGEFWTREVAAGAWTPASPVFLQRNSGVVELIEHASVVTVTDVFPAEVYPYLNVVDDRSAPDPGITLSGPTVVDVDGERTVRKLTLRVDRPRLGADEPSLARRLQLTGDDPVDVEVWLDRTGVVVRLSAPAGVTTVGGAYRLVAATTSGAGPFDDFSPGVFDAPSRIGE